MKQIVAIVKPHVAEGVVETLRRAPVEAFTVREVKGYGRQKDYLDQYGQSEFALAFLPKVEIAVWVDDARVEEVAGRITEAARTGRMGDGKVFILPVARFEQVIDLAKS
ncbi:MAG: P-II family nitrogen regulator [Planctomycetaceae bacterium]|nr:P-II family nitrogen regulator [Planctomycetaceae bacterium]